MPHPTTLMKLTTRCGAAAVEGFERGVVGQGRRAKLLRTNRVRVDTTVVPSNVAYPTDSGLLARAIGRIAAIQRRIKAAGGATRTRVRHRSRSAGRRAHAIGAKLRMRSAAGRDEALAAVRRVTGELADLAETAATDAERVLTNAKRHLRRPRAEAKELRANGDRHAAGPTSWTARPGGRRSRSAGRGDPADRGTEAAAAGRPDTVRGDPAGQPARPRCPSDRQGPARETGRVRPQGPAGRQRRRRRLDHTVEQGNPADAPQLAPAVERITRRTGRPPCAVTADGGYGKQKVDDALHDLGVRYVVIPRKGRPRQRQTGRGTPTSVPTNHQVENGDRRQVQHHQTRIRMGPNPH